MARDLRIFDWRRGCVPIDQVFRAGGEDGGGGLTLGGFESRSPEPGGRAELVMAFNTFGTVAANLDASWTISRIMNGAIFRIGIYRSVQLVTAAALGGSDIGEPWRSGRPWGNDQNWSFNPTAPVAQAALRGSVECVIDMSTVGEMLRIGHVIGFAVDGYDFAHVVMDIEYEDGIATLEVSPPLRRPLTTDDVMTMRPKMLVTCSNGRDVMDTFRKGKHMAFNAARFVEALV